MGTSEFMAAYAEEAVPFSQTLDMWNGRVWLNVRPAIAADTVYLHWIAAVETGLGDGSLALDWLIGLARKHSVAIHGCVQRRGRRDMPTLTQSQLRAWYKRHGFKVKKDGHMEFVP